MDRDEYRKKVELATENRFGYYRNKTNEELEKERELIINTMKEYMEILDKKNASGYQKSEIRNSDLIFEREKLEFVDKVLDERNNKRGIKK